MVQKIFFTNDEHDPKAVKVRVVTDKHESGVTKAFEISSRANADIIAFKPKDPYSATKKVYLTQDRYED